MNKSTDKQRNKETNKCASEQANITLQAIIANTHCKEQSKQANKLASK
jgi:hypothetical protein